MTIVIAHADADKGAALSLARFLKTQSLPVRVTAATRLTTATKQADSVVMLWSRDMSRYFKNAGIRVQRAMNDVSQTILVDIDGAMLPESVSGQVINARAAGLRESRSWRAVTAIAKNQAEIVETPLEIGGTPVPVQTIAKAVNDGVDAPAASVDFKLPYIVMFLVTLGLVAATTFLLMDEIGVKGLSE